MNQTIIDINYFYISPFPMFWVVSEDPWEYLKAPDDTYSAHQYYVSVKKGNLAKQINIQFLIFLINYILFSISNTVSPKYPLPYENSTYIVYFSPVTCIWRTKDFTKYADHSKENNQIKEDTDPNWKVEPICFIQTICK